MYKKIKTKEEFPLKDGYYAIETDRIYGNIHWSTETKIWTLEDGTKWEAEYPNYWLKEIENNGNF